MASSDRQTGSSVRDTGAERAPADPERIYLDIISGRRKGIFASLVRSVLRVAEIPYRMAMASRNRKYDRDPERCRDLGRPTISVGNITAGGTGKTPVVQWLVAQLQAEGRRPAVLMRGYRKAGSVESDEQIMLQQLLPGIIIEANPDRAAGAAAVLARDASVDVLVLDDAFQHRRARRDFDLVLINAAEPFGYGHVHPRGLLREGLQGLKRASAILMTHASEATPEKALLIQQAIRRFTAAPVFHCDHINEQFRSEQQAMELSDLATRPFYFFAGIGHPQPLAASLQRFAHSYRGEHFFPDHHAYTAADIDLLADDARSTGANLLLTTQKDYAKLRPLLAQSRQDLPPVYYLSLSIRLWENEQGALLGEILRAVKKQA